MLTHGNLLSNAVMLNDYWGWRRDDVLIHALPIFHVHGLFVPSTRRCSMAARWSGWRSSTPRRHRRLPAPRVHGRAHAVRAHAGEPCSRAKRPPTCACSSPARRRC